MGFFEILQRADADVHRTLGDFCAYAPGIGEPVVVPCLFDAAYRVEDLQQPGVSTSSPAVFVRLAELPGDPTSDVDARVTRDGITYRIHEVKPDGLGGATLLLNRV